jgi:hypothetical protein
VGFFIGKNLRAEQQTLLSNISDPMFRETARDFMVNQQFRKDYWVKGARKLNPLAQALALRAVQVMLTTNRADVALKVSGALGEASLQESVYTPILDLLADHKPRSLGQIEQALQAQGLGFAQITQATMVLSGAGHLGLVQDNAVITKAQKHADKLNAHLCLKAHGSNQIAYLASPVTGGGVTLNRFQQLFVASIASGKKHPTEWAQAAWQVLEAQNQKLLKDGQALESAEDNLTELTAQAQVFADQQFSEISFLYDSHNTIKSYSFVDIDGLRKAI